MNFTSGAGSGLMGSLGGGKGFLCFIVFSSLVRTLMHTVLDWTYINKCDAIDIPSMKNFDATQYMGTWYEQKHVKEFEIFLPLDAKCIKAEYVDLKKG